MKKPVALALAACLISATASAAPPRDTQAELTFFLRESGEFVDAAQRAEREFAELYPNVKVVFQHTVVGGEGWGAYSSKILNLIAAGEPPDMVDIAIEGFLALSSKDLMIDLWPLLKDNPDFNTVLADIDENLLKEMESPQTGELNYYPADWNNIVFYYNKAMFDEAGVPYPQEGWTWDEFLETAKAVAKKDASGNTVRYGYRIPNCNFCITPWFLTNGIDKLDSSWTESTVSDPKFAESLKFLHDLIHVHGVSPTFEGGVGDNEFKAEQVAMFNCGHWCMPSIREKGMDVGVVLPPRSSTSQPLTTVFGIGGVGIFKSSQHQELALEFIKVFLGDKFQQGLSESFYSIPASRKWATTPAFLSYPDNAEIFYESTRLVQPIASPPNFAQVESIFIRHLEGYLTGNTDLETTVAEMDSELSRSMSRAYR